MRFYSFICHYYTIICVLCLFFSCTTGKITLYDAEREYDKQLQSLKTIAEKKDTSGYSALYNQIVKDGFNTIKTFPQSYLAFRILQDIYFDLNLDQKKEVFALIPMDSLKNYKKLTKWYSSFEHELATSEECSYVDFCGLTPRGDSLRLSHILQSHTFVLLDFWASWCPSCCKEMPEMKNFYKTNRNVLEIVGVSLDRHEDDWLMAIDTLGLGWMHISDLKGWNCDFSKLYGICSIPTKILISQKGIIVARNKTFAQMQAIIDKRKD